MMCHEDLVTATCTSQNQAINCSFNLTNHATISSKLAEVHAVNYSTKLKKKKKKNCLKFASLTKINYNIDYFGFVFNTEIHLGDLKGSFWFCKGEQITGKKFRKSPGCHPSGFPDWGWLS